MSSWAGRKAGAVGWREDVTAWRLWVLKRVGRRGIQLLGEKGRGGGLVDLVGWVNWVEGWVGMGVGVCGGGLLMCGDLCMERGNVLFFLGKRGVCQMEGGNGCNVKGGGDLTYFCTPTLPSFFWNPCTKAGTASRAEELRSGEALMVVWVVMSYSAHWI